MQIETATGRSRVYSYYNCRSALKHGSCEHRRIPAPELEHWLVEEICARIFTREALAAVLRELQEHVGNWRAERDSTIGTCRRQIQDLERQIERLVASIEALGPAAGDPRILVQRINTHQTRIDALEAQIREVESREPPAITVTEEDLDQIAEFLRAVLTTSENPRKTRSFLANIVDRVYIEGDVARIRYRPEALTARQGTDRFAAEVVWLPAPTLLRTAELTVRLPPRWRRRAA